ncbi:hypothetical protein BCCGELA001_29855 [Bradyrhizobium sp. CCGE-LA001]|nr:hypothetical protein BCCGELA001_29855 [Bradyrhizobium sp. CCGE-LA001]
MVGPVRSARSTSGTADGSSLPSTPPELERKGKAAAPYEFDVKADIVMNNRRTPGGLFVPYARSLPILTTIIPCKLY